MKKVIFALLFVVGLLSLNLASAGNFEAAQKNLEGAMKAEVRGEADTIRDRNRKPIETLEFFGLRENMTVVELLPGGGWYTKLLAPAVADKGKLYIALGTSRVEKNVLTQEGFEKVSVVAK